MKKWKNPSFITYYTDWETLQKNDFTKPYMIFTVKHFVVTISNESIVLFVNIKKKLKDKSIKVKAFLTTITFLSKRNNVKWLLII